MDKIIIKKRFPFKLVIGIIIPLICIGFFIYHIIFVDNNPTVFAEKKKLQITTVKLGIFQEYINTNGIILPGGTVFIDAQNAGKVVKVFVEQGSIVTCGQKILELENIDLELELFLKKARVIEKRVELESAKLSKKRQLIVMNENLFELDFKLNSLEQKLEKDKILYDCNSISESELQQVEEDYKYWEQKLDMLIERNRIDRLLLEMQEKQINANINLLENEILRTETSLYNLVITAPVCGQLTALNARVGETKYQGARIGKIDLIGTYKMSAIIDEYYISKVTVGNTGIITATDNEYKVILVSISPEIKGNVFDVEFKFTGDVPPDVIIGQSFLIKLALGNAEESMILERGSFSQSTGGRWVYLLNESETKAIKTTIRIGRNNPDYFEILEGLETGDKVIISNYDDYNGVDEMNIDL